MSKPIRVRYAPSPTGPQHLGGVRTALYNYLFAKKTGGTFIIRIEDTDQNRFVEGAEEYMLDALAWCGIKNDEGPNVGGDYGPYKQSERKHLYRKYAEQLIESGKAYYAFDTSEELEAMRERMKASGNAAAAYNANTREYMKNSLVLPADEVRARIDAGENYVIRIKVPRKEEVKLNDVIRGWVVFHSAQLDDKVLFKSDGMPTYHLANVVDDYLMKITHVIRGEEWLPSAPTHVLLYKFLGWENEMPQFAHLPLILRPDGNGKLSKRDGDRLGFPVFPLNWKDPATQEQSIGFKERGFYAQPFTNMIALLGWHPGKIQQEIFSMEEMISFFELEHVGKSGAKFDFEKAKWFNHEYLKTISGENLAEEFLPVLKEKNISADKDFVARVCNAVKERCTFVSEFWENSFYFFQKPTVYDETMVKKKWNADNKPRMMKLKDELQKQNDFSAAALDLFLHNFVKENNFNGGDILPTLRIMLSGTKNGPAVFEIASLLGKEETINRMEAAIDIFDKLIMNNE